MRNYTSVGCLERKRVFIIFFFGGGVYLVGLAFSMGCAANKNKGLEIQGSDRHRTTDSSTAAFPALLLMDIPVPEGGIPNSSMKLCLDHQFPDWNGEKKKPLYHP